MLGAGLIARNAVKLGLRVKRWVKTSLAPGSQVVTASLEASGLQKDLNKIGYNLVGYGCTSCIGNSGPLPDPVTKAVNDADLVVCAVLSGNRNFEGRVNPMTRANYLPSPMLVVRYARAGSIKKYSPAGAYLAQQGVEATTFTESGTRAGNHEVMMRVTFANIRLKNEMVPGIEGGFTHHYQTDQPEPIFDVAMRYKKEHTPQILIAGKEYGTGSSRDWAAKGVNLLGVKAVVCETFERIPRSNLVGMALLPLQFQNGMTRKSLNLTGHESFDVDGIAGGLKPGMDVPLTIHRRDGTSETVTLTCRIDTAEEVEYFKNGGVLHYVLRNLAHAA